MNRVKRNNLNDIKLLIVGDMQPMSHDEIWFETGESANIHPIPSQQEINVILEEMEIKGILKKFLFPNGREKYLRFTQ